MPGLELIMINVEGKGGITIIGSMCMWQIASWAITTP